MKQITLLLSLAALLMLNSCAKEDPFGIDSGDKVIYKFTAQLPDYIDSRAISDGEKANELFFWVFDENHNELPELRQHNIAFENGVATVEVPLTPGHTYSFAFWAQNEDCTSYTPNVSDISVKYTKKTTLANDDNRDAFYNIIEDITVTADNQIVEEQIKLFRPLAQLNYGISPVALEEAKKAGFDLEGAKVSVWISNAYKKFGLLEKGPIEKGSNKQAVTFQMNDLPPADEPLLIKALDENRQPILDENGEPVYNSYVWLSFNYFVTETGEQPELIDTYIEIETKDGKKFNSGKITNKPVLGYRRTNILLDSFTEDVKFDVVIDEQFDNYDHVVNLVNYQNITPSQLLNINDPNGSYMVNGNGEEIAVDAVKNITAKNILINNVTFKPQGLASGQSPLYFNTESLIMKNVNFTGEVSGSTDVVIVQGNKAKSVTIKDCQFNTGGIYNAIYIDNTPNLNSVLIGNVAFNTANRNNAITVGSTLPNAMINIENCTFNEVSNAVRLFNRTNATGVSLSVKDCTCHKWETTPQYAGFFIFEDLSATADAAIANNVFGPGKVTVTCDNVTGPHGKLMFASPIDGAYQGSTANPNQAYYVYYHKGGMIPYGDGSQYPTFIFK